MLKLPQFTERERGAPMFDMDHGFLASEGDSLFARAAQWEAMVLDCAATSAAGFAEPTAWDPSHTITVPRIVTMDAERTFLFPEHRERFAKFMTFVNKQFGDYAQGMGFLASVLLLTLEEEKVFRIMSTLNSNDKFIPGYWKHEAVALGTDSYVFEFLLRKYNSKVAEHLAKNFVSPETYCQKWFSGLYVHLLPFEYLFRLFENFFKIGHGFLWQFSLALIQQMESQILASNDVGRLYELLRLDPRVTKGVINLDLALKEAASFDVETGIDLKSLRQELFDKHLKARMERKAALEQEEDSDDEIVFSDEEDDEAAAGEEFGTKRK